MGIQFTGLASGMDTQSIIKDLMKAERTKVTAVEKQKTRMQWTKEATAGMNAKIYGFYKESLFKFKSVGTYSQKSVSSSNESVVSVAKTTTAVNGSHTVTVNNMAKGSYLTSEPLGLDLNGNQITSTTTADKLYDFAAAGVSEIKLNVKTSAAGTFGASNEITILATDTVSDIVGKMRNLGLDMNVSLDTKFNRIFASSTKTGSDVELAFGTSSADPAAITRSNELLAKLGFGTKVGSAGQSASFTYNGTLLTSETNEISVNGLNLTLRADTGSSTIGVTQNTDAIYDTVKDFLTKYNELITDMRGKINAESARTFEPLTSEEKEAMTEEEVSLWESKIKNSLLRRDETMTSIMSDMRSVLTGSSGVDTSSFAYKTLSELGIGTGNYTEGGILHLDGNEDDFAYSLKTNKLKQAIESNPEGVMELMTALGDKLYSSMSNRMKSTSLSSALNFFNDKVIDKKLTDYDTKIANLEERLELIESRYYAQFTAMEQAIQRSNSTGNWLSQQLAGLQ
jgi:flagellar hook-associated protein 2